MSAALHLLSTLRRLAAGLAFCSLGLAAQSHAALTQVASRAALPTAGQQTVSWAALGGDLTDAGAAPTSGTVTVTGAKAYTVMQQAPAGTWNGDFAATDTALVMFDANTGDVTSGDFDIALGGSWSGFGVQVGALLNNVPWEIDVLFYDAANVLLGSFDNLTGVSTDAQDGSAFFIGAVSSAADIARVVISGLGDGAAINQISLSPRATTPVPIPATLLLALSALGLMAATRRRA